MPKYVDHDARREEIVNATLRILAERGPRGLTIRSVAEEMGGSSTVVTHYFPTRDSLIEGVVDSFAEWSETLYAIEAGSADARERLRVFLHWFVPASEEALNEERARMNLLAERNSYPPVEGFIRSVDTWARTLIGEHLEGLADPDEIEGLVDLIRVVTNGVALAAVELPEDWPPERQFATVDRLLDLLDLLEAS